MDVIRKFLSHARVGQPCLLCTATTSGLEAICPSCQEDLPYIESACQRCGLPLPQPAISCGHCQNDPPTFISCSTIMVYQYPVDYLLQQYKAHGNQPIRHWWLRQIETFLGRASTAMQGRWQGLVPVPLHWRKQWQRGFNQSFEIAQVLSRQLDLPIYQATKSRDSTAQKNLNRKQRLANLTQGFHVGDCMQGKRLLIVDDVVTTGATANALSQCLYKNGAKSVDVFALARTPKPKDK